MGEEGPSEMSDQTVQAYPLTWPEGLPRTERPISPTTAIGAAAVHMACADMVLAGHMVHMAMEGACYDLILDACGQLLRVQVKGTTFLRSRRRAEKGYCFNTNRNTRPNRRAGPVVERTICPRTCDLLALVVLPERTVSYLPVLRPLPGAIWIYPVGTPSFLRKGIERRRRADSLPLNLALTDLNVAKKAAMLAMGAE